MTLLFRWRNDPAKGELDELRKLLRQLELSRPRVRLAVGAGVQLANSEFIRRFGGIERFRSVSAEIRKVFSDDLSDLELGLRSHEPAVALGVGLYRIWLTDAFAERREVAQVLGEVLTELSRKASGA